MKKPPCALWNAWTGPEIEGTTDIGAKTLFIRRSNNWRRHLTDSIKRIWFCYEYTDWQEIRRACQLRPYQVCLEVNPLTIERVPKDIRANVTLYFKLDVKLKPGDHVCVGPAFSDEAFRIGTGATVHPIQYEGDIRLE